MDFFKQHIFDIINSLIGAIALILSLQNWRYSKFKLKFYDSSIKSKFYYTTPESIKYRDSTCVAFFKVKISNLSLLPCTIREVELNVENYQPTFSRGSTDIYASYEYTTDKKYTIYKKSIIELPYTIPPFGYVEGSFIFPYAPRYNGDSVFADITVKTPKKDYYQTGKVLINGHAQLSSEGNCTYITYQS